MMSKRIHELPMGHMYIVLPNGAAAQLDYMEVNALQVALDHLKEHLEALDVSKNPNNQFVFGPHKMELDSVKFLKEVVA